MCLYNLRYYAEDTEILTNSIGLQVFVVDTCNNYAMKFNIKETKIMITSKGSLS